MSEPCSCGHGRSLHPFGMSEALVFAGRCMLCKCQEYQPQPQVGGEGVRAHDRDRDLDLDGIRDGSGAGILAEEHRGKSQPAGVGDSRPLARRFSFKFSNSDPGMFATDDGAYVLYSAHQELLAAGEARAAALQRDCQEQDHFRIEAEMRAEAAEAAIVSLQAEHEKVSDWALRLEAQRNDLQAQLQAIAQEMRDDGDSSLKYWMAKLDAVGKQ